MPACPSCGAESPEGFRFCGACGDALTGEPKAARETRKTVTVIFCDVSGSTALGERLDPESLRRVMARYFDVAREAIERHGGTVEKFIGDAVMAVFGIPTLHEDDALRALRAAGDLREAFQALNEELERDYGTTLAIRIGVNTGEVVTGTDERLVTGDAVNVAARLEQAARPGEILLGPETLRLARDAVAVEPLEPLELKGKSDPLRAFRLVSIEPGAPGLRRRLDAEMVGRTREQRLLADTWERTVSEQSCSLFTLLGTAGVGKSRLATEFLDGLDARIGWARCLSYGEGITYWPVVEIVTQLLGKQPAARLEELGLDGLAASTITGLLGGATVPTSPEQISWAVRGLLAAVAQDRPLVVVFDDIHWGEPTFFDLVEQVADLSRGTPILLLCLARPELLERRPGWGGGMLNATTVMLEPLSAEETDELIERLLGDARLDGSLHGRIREAAGGNPLFVEEMLAMLAEDGSEGMAVPPTIHALLAARLDQLAPPERGVLERGAVEGQVFHRGAVESLAPDDVQVEAHLTKLVRKDLVRPERGALAGEDAFRFRHLLIRDAAYEALPKASRADLHERFAAWLEEHGSDLVELDEIVGYHLEQAYTYRQELGPVDEAGRELARQAAARLASGGRTAFLRGDARASEGLFGRAVELLPEGDPMRLALLPDLADALADRGEFRRAVELLEEAAEGARVRGDERLTAHVRLRKIGMAAHTAPDQSAEGLLAEAESIVPTLERLADDAGLAEAWSLIGRMRFFLGRAASAEEAYERAVAGARQAGELAVENEALEWWAGAKRFGPAPVREALEFMESLPEAAMQDAQVAGYSHAFRASLMAMEGRLDESRALLARTQESAEEFGLWFRRAAHTMEGGFTELLAGEPGAAEHQLRDGFERLGSLGETGFRSTIGTLLAEALYRQGRYEEAEAIIAEVATLTQPDDFEPQARSRTIRARILARRGDLAEAERFAQEALDLVAETDYLDNTAEVLEALAEVFRATRGLDEADGALRAALGLYEQKGNIVAASRVRARLAEPGETAPFPES